MPSPRTRTTTAALCLWIGAAATLAQEQPQPPLTPPPLAESLPPEESQEAVLVLTDGRRYTGMLVSRDPAKVILRISGIDTEFPAAQMDRLQVLPPVLERYRAMRDAIDPADILQMLRLVEWLRAREYFDLALEEVDRALSANPGSAEALRARALIAGQIELQLKARARRGANPDPLPPPGVEGDPPLPDSPARREPFPLLTPEQVNLIKVFEVDLKDPPNLLIKRDAITRLMTEHAGDPLIPGTAEGRDAMYRMAPERLLDVMFRLQARNLYPQVEVIGQPRSMKLFRDDAHRTWLINGCATTRCHGGEEAGRLFLSNTRVNSDASVYTNFLILDRYRMESGIGLINYEAPVRSPLLQAGLPRKDALFPHPEVPGPHGRGDLWRPVFRSTRDTRYEQAMEWIQSMYRPRPSYPVDYTPPHPSLPEPPAQQVDRGR